MWRPEPLREVAPGSQTQAAPLVVMGAMPDFTKEVPTAHQVPTTSTDSWARTVFRSRLEGTRTTRSY